MKFSEQWLREWINPDVSSQELVQQLTLAGLEVDSVEPIANDFTNIVVGYVIDVKQHPDADRLRVCLVDIGETDPVTIVCGGQNVQSDLKVPVAKIDAVLNKDFKIKKSKLRGVESHGMICSESELGLAETSSGIMELPSEAPIGQNIRDYLKLDDVAIDIELTPNRGDCLSLLGIAREVAAINQQTLTPPIVKENKVELNETIKITNSAPKACPHYIGRVIRNIKTVNTPLWMKEKLRRSGFRSVSLVVDITNFVLLELGQPLHAFNLDHVKEGIEIRFAKENESLVLLDTQTITLSSEDLVIANKSAAIALAGIKGGQDSGIAEDTKDIFLESALFNPTTISRTTRRYNLHTDSSHRFERGVDLKLQRLAVERASELILEIAGGMLGPIIEFGDETLERQPINLRFARVENILGIAMSKADMAAILERLGMQLAPVANGWQVTPPSYRNDINAEIDLIEEIARLYGYDKIPGKSLSGKLNFADLSETKLNLNRLRHLLVDLGYQEAITFSFVDPNYEKNLNLQPEPLQLLNPISSDLSTMRSNHWAGLIQAFQYNRSRQQARVRFFEIGLCFINEPSAVKQQLHLGGLVAGSLFQEQWGENKRPIDFYDVKSDIESILNLTSLNYQFMPEEYPALHPGKSAAIYVNKHKVGHLGAIHPTLAHKFDITEPLYLFDINLESIMFVSLPSYETISKFPAIRRDIALVVATDVLAERIREKILDSRGDLLKNVQIFDIYQGKGIDTGKKSIALGLIFQHSSRTLVDAEINDFMHKLITDLHKEFNATLRD